MFRATVASRPNKTLFITPNRRWTYLEAEEYSNHVANHFVALGSCRGDTITPVTENRPGYV